MDISMMIRMGSVEVTGRRVEIDRVDPVHKEI